jgi:hypothetical protein
MADGSVLDFVFDPSLFDGPIPAKDWAKIMHTSAHGLQVTIFGKIPSGQYGDYHPRGLSTRKILRSKHYHPKMEMNQFKSRNSPSHELFHSPYRGDKPPVS